MTHTVPVLIGTFLESEYVDVIAAADSRVDVLYAPELLPVPRYACDHHGVPRELTDDQQRHWEKLLATAEISFDFEWQAPADLPRRAPGLRWVQATSAGIGTFMRRTGLDRTDLIATTAAGTHAVPLAEFALAGALYFAKGLPHLQARMRDAHWERYTTTQLAGRTVTVVGLGSIGREVARVFHALRTNVVGVGRAGRDYDLPAGVRTVTVDRLDDVLPDTDVLVLCVPGTDQTEGLIGAGQLARLPAHAVLVNIARGAVVDEPALVEALRAGRLGGAALDVFATEPLPADSPLWAMPNVIVSPHSASTVSDENRVLTDLFVDNLHRYLDGVPLRNRYQPELGY